MKFFDKFFSKKSDDGNNNYRNSIAHLQDLPSATWSINKAEDYMVEGYGKNVIAYRCVKEISDSLSTLTWNVYNSQNKIIKKHPMMDLLNRPNPMLSGSGMMQQLQIFKQITGNSFIYAIFNNKTSPPKELYVVSPAKITPVGGSKFFPVKGYKYKVKENPDTWTFIPVNQITGESDLLHFKSFNPKNPLWGQSPLEAASRAVDTHNEASVWNMRLLQNGARPSGILKVDNNLDETQREVAKASWQAAFGGAINAGKTALMEGGIEYQPLMLSPKDMDFLNSKNVSAREIATAYRVPPMLLNITGDNTYDNMQEARLSLWEDTLLPEADALRDELNHWLTPLFGNNIRLDYDKNKIPALTTRREKVWYALAAATFLTIDEQRSAAGYEPLPNGEGEKLAGGSSPLQGKPDENDGENDGTAIEEEVDNTMKSAIDIKSTTTTVIKP